MDVEVEGCSFMLILETHGQPKDAVLVDLPQVVQERADARSQHDVQFCSRPLQQRSGGCPSGSVRVVPKPAA